MLYFCSTTNPFSFLKKQEKFCRKAQVVLLVDDSTFGSGRYRTRFDISAEN